MATAYDFRGNQIDYKADNDGGYTNLNTRKKMGVLWAPDSVLDYKKDGDYEFNRYTGKYEYRMFGD